MITQLQSVYEIYCIDKNISALKLELDELSQSNEFKRKMESAERAATSADAVIVKMDADIKDLELKMESLDEKLAASEKRYSDGSVTSSKELLAIEKDIEQMKQLKSRLDTELIRQYEAVEPFKTRSKDATKAMKVWKQRYEAAAENERADREKIEAKLKSLERKRKSAEKQIKNKRLLARYEIVLASTGDTGAAEVIDNRCGACHMTLTRNIARVVQSDEDYEMCESCGRILLSCKVCEES